MIRRTIQALKGIFPLHLQRANAVRAQQAAYWEDRAGGLETAYDRLANTLLDCSAKGSALERENNDLIDSGRRLRDYNHALERELVNLKRGMAKQAPRIPHGPDVTADWDASRHATILRVRVPGFEFCTMAGPHPDPAFYDAWAAATAQQLGRQLQASYATEVEKALSLHRYRIPIQGA